MDPNRPYPEGIAFDEAWRQRQRADAMADDICKLMGELLSINSELTELTCRIDDVYYKLKSIGKNIRRDKVR